MKLKINLTNIENFETEVTVPDDFDTKDEGALCELVNTNYHMRSNNLTGGHIEIDDVTVLETKGE